MEDVGQGGQKDDAVKFKDADFDEMLKTKNLLGIEYRVVVRKRGTEGWGLWTGEWDWTREFSIHSVRDFMSAHWSKETCPIDINDLEFGILARTAFHHVSHGQWGLVELIGDKKKKPAKNAATKSTRETKAK